jgi:Bacterial Ig domain/Cadherin domain/RTX calcium-binding nonapeptide repeat (4 copies)
MSVRTSSRTLLLLAVSGLMTLWLAGSATAMTSGSSGHHRSKASVASPSCDPALTGTSGPNTINGTPGDDHICGLGGNDTLNGMGGNDIIEGGTGIDTINGGSGDDQILGQDGNDRMNGGDGTDSMDGGNGLDGVTYFGAPAGVTVDLSAAAPQTTNDGFGTTDTLTSVENLVGSAFADHLTGTASKNVISGDLGTDTLSGLAGTDYLYGNQGNDELLGGTGNDQLTGGQDTDGCDGSTGTNTFFTCEDTNPLNDAPVNSMPAAQSTPQDSGLILSSGGGNLISVSDSDAGAGPIQETLTATHGTLTLATLTGLSFTAGDGTADATMTFSGSPDSVNAALDGMTFDPTAAYFGPATVEVLTSDLGNTGTGGAQTDDDTLNIDVIASNAAPTDIQLSNNSIAENQPSGTDVGTLTTTDPDVGDTHTYTLENTGCGGGPFPDNSSFQIGGVSNDKLQSAASFNFEVKSSYTVCVRATDNGSPAMSFDKQFTISVTNVNEAPTDISLSNNNIDENQPSSSAIGTLSQVGDPDSGETYTFTLLTSGCSGSFPDSSSFQVTGSQLQSAVSFNFEVKSSYSICVRVNDPGSPNLSFEKQFTISIDDVNDAPVDGNETTSAVGNTLLEYGSVGSPSSAAKKVVAGNLLSNATDEDQPPQTLTISASDSTSANGGSVSVSSSGAFTYLPAAGFTGSDTFNYTVSDGTGGTDTSTVTVSVASRVWYVKNNATAGGTGRSTDPFDTLTEADTAANATGDITYVYKGDGTTTGLTGGFSLLANQKLLGEPVNLVVGPDTLATGTPANRPTLSGTVALASGSRVEAVDIAGSAGAAIAGTNTGGSDVTNVNLSGGAGGVALTGAGAGTFNFTNFTITTTGGTGFLVNTSGAPTINVGSGSTENVSATGGPAVDVRNVNGASSLAFDAVSSTNSSGAGINLDSNGATPFSAASGSISGAAGNAIDINGGSGNVTYPGTLGNGAGNTADITGRTGGAISLSGDINDTNDAGGGITMSGNSGGSTTFSGTTKTLNTGASAAFSSTGSGHTITFSGGGLNIDTTSGAGFSATGGGTVNVTGTVNTIDSTTGTALNVASTNIGASGLLFQSISSNGATNGIVLNSTGSSGGLTIAGNGGTCSSAGTCTGGAIQSSTDAGVSLTTVPGGVSFARVAVVGGGDDGIRATDVGSSSGTGIALSNSYIANNGNAATENGLDYDNVKGTSSINNTTSTGNSDFNARFDNDNGTGLLTVDTSHFEFNSGAFGSDGLLLNTDGSAIVRAWIKNSFFTGNGDDGFQLLAGGDSSVDLIFDNNTVNTAGNASAASAHAGLNFDSNTTSDVRMSMTGGSVVTTGDTLAGSAIIVNPIGNTSNPAAANSSTFDAVFDNVTIGTVGVAGSGSTTGQGFRVIAVENVADRIVIKNSHISGTSQFAALLRHNDGGGDSDFTFIGNTIRTVGGGNEPIFVQSGSLNTDATSVCADIGGSGGDNTNPPGNDFAGQSSGGVTDIAFRRPSAAAGSHLKLPGFTPPASTNLTSYIQGRNVGNPTALNFSGELETGPPTCQQPTAPTAP